MTTRRWSPATLPGASAGVGSDPGPNCNGSPVAKGSVAEFEAHRPARARGRQPGHGLLRYGSPAARPPLARTRHTTSRTRSRPHTRITMGPASRTRRRKAVFRFTDTTGIAPGTTLLQGRPAQVESVPLAIAFAASTSEALCGPGESDRPRPATSRPARRSVASG